ncbi:MAG: hypothetical protein EA381_13095 [Planctomycetaceae bacterium]|nr:MAG: hypothetical protein EA381_13095 [Planctomycetaceae bacterium]
MAHQPQLFSFTYKDLQEITGLTKAGVSQHVVRGNLEATDLVSVLAFVARYGKPEIRLSILERMIGVDRQVVERGRRQSTSGFTRDELGRVAEEAPKYAAPTDGEGTAKPSGKPKKKASRSKPSK